MPSNTAANFPKASRHADHCPTEQFGPAEPFFPSLCFTIEEMTVAAKGAVLVSGKETMEYDPYAQ